VTVAAGTPSTPAAGEPGTGGAAGYGNASTTGGEALWPVTYLEGTAIVLDPAGSLYAANGAGNLAAWTDGTSNLGHACLSN
jgi:hypothetical protein